MKIFWTNDAFEAEIQRRVFVIRQRTGAVFDPERIDRNAIRVAIAAYHSVGLPAIREDSYFMRPMREALQAFGRHIMREDPPGVWPASRTLSSLKDDRT